MFDLLIIGASAAGASAGVYAARRNLNFKIITYDTGGEVALSGEVANFPGWGETDGIAVSEKFQEHLKIYNVEPEIDVKVTSIDVIPSEVEGSLRQNRRSRHSSEIAASPDSADDCRGPRNDQIRHFQVTADKNSKEVKYDSRTVIVATGVHPRLLNISGEKEYKGKGVTYCTTCDGPLFHDKVVATIGGGNSALESALMMNEIASKVYLINKNPKFKGDQILIDKVEKADKVEIIYEAMTLEIFGNEFVKGLKYKDKDEKEHELEIEGIFVHIGVVPNSDFLPEEVEKDKFGQVIVDKICATNIPGLFAAGDVTDVPYKQIAIASGQGVCAALSVVDYLNKLK